MCVKIKFINAFLLLSPIFSPLHSPLLWLPRSPNLSVDRRGIRFALCTIHTARPSNPKLGDISECSSPLISIAHLEWIKRPGDLKEWQPPELRCIYGSYLHLLLHAPPPPLYAPTPSPTFRKPRGFVGGGHSWACLTSRAPCIILEVIKPQLQGCMDTRQFSLMKYRSAAAEVKQVDIHLEVLVRIYHNATNDVRLQWHTV